MKSIDIEKFREILDRNQIDLQGDLISYKVAFENPNPKHIQKFSPSVQKNIKNYHFNNKLLDTDTAKEILELISKSWGHLSDPKINPEILADFYLLGWSLCAYHTDRWFGEVFAKGINSLKTFKARRAPVDKKNKKIWEAILKETVGVNITPILKRKLANKYYPNRTISIASKIKNVENILKDRDHYKNLLENTQLIESNDKVRKQITLWQKKKAIEGEYHSKYNDKMKRKQLDALKNIKGSKL